ncbi:MAG: amidohydrolase [Acholeplasmataceae bacterium]|nr:amidohydrolase [Acholeplasmataceae bacterium]
MTLYTNGVIHTMDDNNTILEAIACEDGYIIDTAPDPKKSYKTVVDLKGAHLYPGFVDAHMHLFGYGMKLSVPDLGLSRDLKTVMETLNQVFKDKPLYAIGYVDLGLNRFDLDTVSDTHPILLRHNDYHSVTVNSVLLTLAGIDSEDGILTEAMAEKAIKAMSAVSDDDLEEMLETAIKSLWSYGITGAHSDDLAYYNGYKPTLRIVERVLEDHPFRAHLLMHHEILGDFLKSRRQFLDQTDFLQLGAIKIFYDGTLSSKTALMHAPYQGSDSNGLVVIEGAALEKLMKKIRRNYLTAAIHVIGDQGLSDVVRILRKNPPQNGLHDRIIHASFADLETVRQMKGMPVVLDIQPQFISTDLPWGLGYFSTLPALIYPFKTYLKAGLTLAGSSDAPVEIPNPLLGIKAAVTRVSDHDGSVDTPAERLTINEAIRLYTQGANVPTYHADRGMIKKGFVADFTVFDQDLEALDPKDVDQAKNVLTVVAGKTVYDQGQS